MTNTEMPREFIDAAREVFNREYCAKCINQEDGGFCEKATFKAVGAGYTSRVHCNGYRSKLCGEW